VEYRFKIAAEAWRDLKSIWRHIARDNPVVATSFRDELLSQAESLRFFPHRNASSGKRRDIRKLTYKSYLIFYKVDETKREISVLRFWHGAQDTDRLRLKEEGGTYSAPPPLQPVFAAEAA